MRTRPGFALAVAMVAIVVIGALVAGAFWTSMQDFRSARNGLTQERALTAAEYGQNYVLGNWSSAWVNMKPGDTLAWSLTPDAGSSARVRMTKLNPATFWVVSEGSAGTAGSSLSRRRVNSILRIKTPELKIRGAITTAGPMTISGNVPVNGINGNDANPTSWADCPPAGASKAGLSNDNPSTEITVSGSNCGSSASTSPCLTGSSKVSTDASSGDLNTYNNWGGFNWDSLTAMADGSHTFTVTGTSVTSIGTMQPVGTATTCTPGITNWGEPWRTAGSIAGCYNYYPVVWIKGTSTATALVNGSRGQGILLVENNLKLSGGFEYYGLVLVRGTIDVNGTPGLMSKIVGALMVGNAAGGSKLNGNASVQYSSCAVTQALAHTTPRPVPAPQRSWADIY